MKDGIKKLFDLSQDLKIWQQQLKIVQDLDDSFNNVVNSVYQYFLQQEDIDDKIAKIQSNMDKTNKSKDAIIKEICQRNDPVEQAYHKYLNAVTKFQQQQSGKRTVKEEITDLNDIITGLQYNFDYVNIMDDSELLKKRQLKKENLEDDVKNLKTKLLSQNKKMEILKQYQKLISRATEPKSVWEAVYKKLTPKINQQRQKKREQMKHIDQPDTIAGISQSPEPMPKLTIKKNSIKNINYKKYNKYEQNNSKSIFIQVAKNIIGDSNKIKSKYQPLTKEQLQKITDEACKNYKNQNFDIFYKNFQNKYGTKNITKQRGKGK